jgi:hypothetical protein
VTENEARAIIYQAFVDDWGSLTEYAFDNEAFNPEGLEEWVRLTVRQSTGGQHTLGAPGGRRYRRRGLVFVQVFAPVDKGLQRFDELARAARDIFEGKTLSLVEFYDGNIREIGKDPNGPWFSGNVSVVFSFDETK